MLLNSEDISIRDTLVKLPSCELEYLLDIIFDLLIDVNVFQTLDIVFIINQVLNQRGYYKNCSSLKDCAIMRIIRDCGFKTKAEIKMHLSKLNIDSIRLILETYRAGCWSEILHSIIKQLR